MCNWVNKIVVTFSVEKPIHPTTDQRYTQCIQQPTVHPMHATTNGTPNDRPMVHPTTDCTPNTPRPTYIQRPTVHPMPWQYLLYTSRQHRISLQPIYTEGSVKLVKSIVRGSMGTRLCIATAEAASLAVGTRRRSGIPNSASSASTISAAMRRRVG
jgi:hypothetical protein